MALVDTNLGIGVNSHIVALIATNKLVAIDTAMIKYDRKAST